MTASFAHARLGSILLEFTFGAKTTSGAGARWEGLQNEVQSKDVKNRDRNIK